MHASSRYFIKHISCHSHPSIDDSSYIENYLSNYPFYIRVAKLPLATKNGSVALSCNKETGMCVQSWIKECSSPHNCQNKCGKRISDCINGRCKCRKCVRSKECAGMCLQRKMRKIIVKEKCLCRKGICRRFKLKVFITLDNLVANLEHAKKSC